MCGGHLCNAKEGPVATSVTELITRCSKNVSCPGELKCYWDLFPMPGGTFEDRLAASVMKVAFRHCVFPACTDKEVVRWVEGQSMTLRTRDLKKAVQDALVEDGLDLVDLPSGQRKTTAAAGRPPKFLGSGDLCKFLRDRAKDTHDLSMACLSNKSYITELLSFAAHGCKPDSCGNLFVLNQLLGVPLLLTHDGQVTRFRDSEKFSSMHDLLPGLPHMFMDQDAHKAVVSAVDTTAKEARFALKVQIPGVRESTLQDAQRQAANPHLIVVSLMA